MMTELSAKRRATALLCLALAALTAAAGASAASLSVEPLRLELEPAARTAAVTVRNDDAAPVVIQARILAWSQPEGRDDLEETREFLVTPAVVEIPAHGFQVLRIGRRIAALPSANEKTFRMLIKEVLPEGGPETGGVRMAMEMSLPIFVGAASLEPAALEWTAVREDESVRLTARNTGERRARVSAAELLDAGGRSLGRWHGVTYLLAGATRSFRFRSDATLMAGSEVTLRLTTESGPEEIHAMLAGTGG